MATDATTAETPKTAGDYGYVDAFLDRHPDVRKVLNQAIAGGWSVQRTQAEIKGTDWWKTRTDAQRKWDILSTENPEEANRQIHEAAGNIRQRAAAMGIQLESGDAWKYAKQFLMNGSTDQEQAYALAAEFNLPGAGKALTGTAASTEAGLKGLAQAYGIKLSSGTEQKYIQDVLAGRQDLAGYEDVFREQAKVLYPTIARNLDTMTVHDYMSPYLEIAAKELGVPTFSMDSTNPMWTKMLTGANGQPMTADEWTQTIRQDPKYRWDQSVGAKAAANDVIRNLRSVMGG